MNFTQKMKKAKKYHEYYELAAEYERIANHLERRGDKKESEIRERWSQSLTAYSECVSLKPENPRAWNGIGWVLYKLKDYKNALLNLERALSADPKYSQAYINMGIIKRNMKDYEGSLEAFENAKELSPHNKWAWYHAGSIHYIFGNIDLAAEYLEKAQEISSSNITIGRLFDMVRRAQRHNVPEPIEQILNSREPLSEGGQPIQCSYCAVKISKEGQNASNICKRRLRQLVWETSSRIPQKAKTDLKRTKVYGLHKTEHIDRYGIKTTGQRMGKHGIKTLGSRFTPQLQIEDFEPLPGIICPSCSSDFLADADKCLSKLTSKPIFSKIVKSQEKVWKCYVKVFKNWVGKIRR